MEHEALSKIIPAIVLLGIMESIGGLYFEDKRTKNDFTIELLRLVRLPTLIQPVIFLIVLWGLGLALPGLEDYFIGSLFWWHILAFLILDDLTQYWWHRLSHVNRKMWKLHRPHHVVEEMGVLVSYRNSMMYFALMPGIWFLAALVYLGMRYVYLVYLPIKLIVILLAHSGTKWDRYLYKIFQPIAWIIERTISTPSTHLHIMD